VPPRPIEHTTAPAGRKLARIGIRPGLAAALHTRWARQDAGLSQKAFGERGGVSQQQIAKLENPDENPTLDTLDRVSRALGLHMTLGFEAPERFSVPPARRAAKVRQRRGQHVT
jgi:transcriptional regulator with XRE-family HTH domain